MLAETCDSSKESKSPLLDEVPLPIEDLIRDGRPFSFEESVERMVKKRFEKEE
jgi:hypothetical protein